MSKITKEQFLEMSKKGAIRRSTPEWHQTPETIFESCFSSEIPNTVESETVKLIED